MIYRETSKLKEKLSVIGFGCWSLAGEGSWSNSNEKDSIKAVETAMDLGVNFFDTAPVYGLGESDRVLRKALGNKRNKVIIGTKCGLVWDDSNNVTNNLSKESLLNEIDESLKRLGTDYIDVYQIHWPNNYYELEETIDALMEIKKSGKIKYIGLCNYSLEDTKKAMNYGEISSLQNLYNMIERNAKVYHSVTLSYKSEQEIIPYAKENGLAFFPYSPLAQGLLTGKFNKDSVISKNDVRFNNPQFHGEKFAENLKLLDELRVISSEINRPLNEIALNWMVKNEGVTSIIAGASNVSQIERNVNAINWSLDDEIYNKINKLLKD